MRTTRIDVPGYEEVFRLEDPDGFVALHRTRPGPAFGGTRMRDYASIEAALADALRLAEAMTRKYAINALPFGGGKAVIMRQSIRDRREALHGLGDFVESLGGRFITGSDLGVSTQDVAILQSRTRHVECEDGSEASAQSVLWAMRGALGALRGRETLTGVRIGIQGLGALGYRLAELCVREKAEVVAGDIDRDRSSKAERDLSVRVVPADEVLFLPADILAPCAVGGVVERQTIRSLRCSIVCGGANNILDDDSTADLLHEAGIAYVPDFLSNSGAAIEGAWTRLRGPADCSAEIRAVRASVVDLLERARGRHCPPLRVALEDIASRIPKV